MFLKYCSVFQCFIFLTLSFIFIHNVQSSTSNLKYDSEILKALRPLKYDDGSCTKFCEKIMCQPVKECDKGLIIKNETYCGCCEACVKFLGKFL